MNAFHPHCSPQGNHDRSHFTDPKAEAQRGQVTYTGSQISINGGGIRVVSQISPCPNPIYFFQFPRGGDKSYSNDAHSTSLWP